ncbi:unnamed protein product, partial [Mesorhabditis belari]|uniref:Protein kinase domain-containing protein n=1 Tax=Mesorhabditis belari TaxID=2138241 RepID=A0AAF3FAR5_9BILA
MRVINDPNLYYTVATVLQWAKEMFTALVYLEDRKVIHQDIKPENIFVNKEFALKIGDFGIMRRLDLKDDGVDGGTWPYKPPEKCQADYELSHQIDVFAAGLVLWEVIERRNLTAPLVPISFTKNSLELAELHDLVKSCSDRSTPWYERFDSGSQALEVVESLEKEEKFSRLQVKPERRFEERMPKEITKDDFHFDDDDLHISTISLSALQETPRQKNVRSLIAHLEEDEESVTIDKSETDLLIPPLSSTLWDFHYREQSQEKMPKEKEISYEIAPSNNQTRMTSIESSFHLSELAFTSLQISKESRIQESIIGFQMMNKIDRETHFDRIRVKANACDFGDFDHIEIGNFHSDFLDVNEVRRKIAKRFLKAIRQMTTEQQKLIRKEMEDFIGFVSLIEPDETFRHGNPKWGEKYFREHGASTKKVKKENSFFTEDFHLESISVCCRVTCRGLVYIALNDLREFLEQMARSMSGWHEELSQPIEEDEEEERNWMKKKIANFWIKLKKELIPIKPYQMSVFQEDSPFRPFFKPVEKKRQINESTECLELLFGNG